MVLNFIQWISEACATLYIAAASLQLTMALLRLHLLQKNPQIQNYRTIFGTFGKQAQIYPQNVKFNIEHYGTEKSSFLSFKCCLYPQLNSILK